MWWGKLQAGPRDQSPLHCVPLSLPGPAIAYIPFEVPNNYPQHPLLSLAEDNIQGEGFGYFGELGLLGLSHVYILLNFV